MISFDEQISVCKTENNIRNRKSNNDVVKRMPALRNATLETKTESFVYEMAWKYVLSYIISVVCILKYNDALNLDTLTEFTKNFRGLVDELAVYFEPVGFPIELVARLCMDKLPKIH